MNWLKRFLCLHVWEKAYTDRLGDIYFCVKCSKRVRSDTLPISYKDK